MKEIMSESGNSPRNPARRAQFVESFAAVLSEAGFPPMPARVFAALLASDSCALTAAELSGSLRASPAAISGAVRYLMQINLASRERKPGSRRDLYRVHNDVWYETMARRDRVLFRCEQSLREGIVLLGGASGGGVRLVETLAFFEFMQDELRTLLERWRERKKRINFAAVKRSSHERTSRRFRA